MKAILLSTLAASLACRVAGHAYVFWPPSREATGGKLLPYNYNAAVGRTGQVYDKKRFGEKVKSKHGAGQGGALPGGKGASRWSQNADGCNALPMGPVMATYTEGQEIEVVIPVHSEHGGEYEFRLCTEKWDTISGDEARLKCLDTHLLHRQCVDGKGKQGECSCKSDKCKGWAYTDREDPAYAKYKDKGPKEGYMPVSTSTQDGGHVVRMKLPANATCEHCTLQWYWYTAFNEDWWTCSDIKIEKYSGAPTPAPTLPPPEEDTAELEKRVATLEAELKRLAPLELEVKLLKARVSKLITGPTTRRRYKKPNRRRHVIRRRNRK